jgi:hypothetical protein
MGWITARCGVRGQFLSTILCGHCSPAFIPGFSTASSGFDLEPREQARRICAEHGVNFIPHTAEDLQLLVFIPGSMCRIIERPVMPLYLSRKRGARLICIATNGDDGMDRLRKKVVHVFGMMP